jgi:chromosomal replication initiator protein
MAAVSVSGVPAAVATTSNLATSRLATPNLIAATPETHLRRTTAWAIAGSAQPGDCDGSSDAQAWGRVRSALRAEAGDHHFDAWLAPLTLVTAAGDRVDLAAPSAFVADWVDGHYAETLRHHWAKARPGTRQVVISIHAGAAACQPAAAPPLAVAAPVENRYSFASFVVGRSNELAYNAALAMAEPGAVAFNPLFVYGPTGLGKTHLLHAIGNAFLARQPGARVAYLSAERFMVEFLAALRAKDTIAFKQKLRAVDLLMIDDVQFIAGKESTQEEFFHTMNEIIGAGKRLVITADRSPQNLEGIQERILGRMAWGLVADINPADYELRLQILHAKLAAMPQRIAVPAEVVEFLARKITANVRELEGALNRVVAYAGLVNAPVTLDFTRQTLADLLRAHEKKLTVDEIQRKVAEHYHLKLSDMMSARRAREVARPRQVAMYLAKKLTPRSLPEIGRRFGGRDHTTVMHAVKRIEALRASDRDIDADVVCLTRLLEA